ncbi:MAG TPA: hypothetical protein VIV40_00520, partial [Kofleriaceae bacterium]
MIADALAVAVERLGDHAAGVLSRLGGQLGHNTREAHAALGKLDAGARKRRRAAIVVAARAPVPSALRVVHASWLEHTLGELPPRARDAVAAPSADPIDVWLARWATAALPPAVAASALAPPLAAANDSAVVLDWLGRIGADQMAFALG